MHIKIKKGLDLPFEAPSSNEILSMRPPRRIGATFEKGEGRWRLLIKTGDRVKIGAPLAEHKDHAGFFYPSPAGGTVGEIRRGDQRRLLDLEIKLDEKEEVADLPHCDLATAPLEKLLEHLKVSGVLLHLQKRPFSQVCDPNKLPRSIFVKALESAPGVPSAELQVKGHEKAFEAGLSVLSRLSCVHLVYRHTSSCEAFKEAKEVKHHTVLGPHPASNPSIHIEAIDPITSAEDVVWTIDVLGVIAIGTAFVDRRYFIERVVALSGPGLDVTRLGYFAARQGILIEDLLSLASDQSNSAVRHISGDPLTGKLCQERDYLGFNHTSITALHEPSQRQLLHFMRLGLDKFTATRTYLSKFLNFFTRKTPYRFTTHQHGQERNFIDPLIYEEVMPMNIRVVELVKACLREDFGLADRLGLLTVDKDDFALPTFICPSKIEISQIIETALAKRAVDDV